MQTIINVLLLGLVLILAVRVHKLEREADRLQEKTIDAFYVLTHKKKPCSTGVHNGNR